MERTYGVGCGRCCQPTTGGRFPFASEYRSPDDQSHAWSWYHRAWHPAMAALFVFVRANTSRRHRTNPLVLLRSVAFALIKEVG